MMDFMKAVQFEAKISTNGQIEIPEGISAQLPLGVSLHVVLQWDAADAEAVWRVESRKQFEAA
jgi:hypothetical protein